METTAFERAAAAFRTGDAKSGLSIATSGLQQTGEDESLLFIAGACCQELGLFDAGADFFARLTRLCPRTPQYHSNLGFMLRQSGRLQEADVAFKVALQVDPRSYDALLNYGLMLLDGGRFGLARHCFLDALEVDPESLSARIYGALACFECGDASRAASLIPPVQVWAHLDTELRYDLATALIQVGRTEEAERLLSLDASKVRDPGAMARLAMLYERTNQVEAAHEVLAALKRVQLTGSRDIRLDILLVEAALAVRDKRFHEAREASLELLSLNAPVQSAVNTYFTLAKIADREGKVDEVMQWLSKAHEMQFDLAAEIAPEIAASADEPLRIASRWLTEEQAVMPSLEADPDLEDSPVFIVGFPRSGTTMLEQMLDAHPDFKSMDERTMLQSCVELMEKRGYSYPADLNRVPEALVVELRALYWHEVSRHVRLSAGERLVDKNPLNLLRLPMIKRLFPAARIILALRHPCDVMLSCYMQNFRSPAFMVLCSTLERLAKSYVNAMRFWLHHQPLLFADVLVLKYEETVTDLDAQAVRIADYLGIAGSAHLAGFSEHAARKRYISTPSYSQVVEPVNTRAVARWHAYSAYFDPVLPLLQPVADHWSYALDAG